MENTNVVPEDLTGGDSFFKWMTLTFMDKVYAYGVTTLLLVGIVLLNIIKLDWDNSDLSFGYGTDVLFGIFSIAIFQDIPHKSVVAEIAVGIALVMCALTYFCGWQGYIEGFCVVFLTAYWGGYYRCYSKLKRGIRS